jgi:hypothetical protein
VAYFNYRLSFRLNLEWESSSRRVKRSGCDGENKEEKLQIIKMSLDFFVLLYQDKRTENLILRIAVPKEKPRIKPLNVAFLGSKQKTQRVS